jgi:demethylmenaquinone methyltransferase/2-methoxy-6-polyprenyl-1,4-benzoquinol methylase
LNIESSFALNLQSEHSFPLQDYYSRIYKTYDLINRLFTFGQDKRWRNETVKQSMTNNPTRILDLCCGTGDLAIRFGCLHNRQLRITGYDLNRQMLDIANRKAHLCKAGNVEFLAGDVADMPFEDGEIDCITMGFGFRNLTYRNPERHEYLREIARVLKPGGYFHILESAVPENQVIRFFYMLYLLVFLIPIGGILSGSWKAYRYLARSSMEFYSYREIEDLLMPFGLVPEARKKFLFGSVNLLMVKKIST